MCGPAAPAVLLLRLPCPVAALRLASAGVTDPLAPLAELPGVAAAGEQAREALGRAHRHRANLRGWPQTAAESALRGARASAVLDGGRLGLPDSEDLVGPEAGQRADGPPLQTLGRLDPVLAGALRVAQALEGGATSLVTVWHRAPMQALARLHTLAAAGIADDAQLGRPRADSGVGQRLELLIALVTGASRAPAPVLASVAHGELLTLAPFGTADGVVARGVFRLIAIASGLDPHGLGVPELYWMRHSDKYTSAARGFASGTPDGLTSWVVLNSRALTAGAQEALAIAQAVDGSR